MKLLAAAALALAFASSAGAATWTPVSKGTLTNIADPGLLHTRAGSDLVVYGNDQAHTIELSRNGGASRVLVTNESNAGESRLVQQPDGTIQLYFPGDERTERLTSTDDGQTWTGPVVSQTNYISPVESAAVLADGTPVFSVDNTFGVYVFRGLNGESSNNVFPFCCGYAESLAVDSTGLLQVAFWSNANAPNNGWIYAALDGNLVPQRYVNLSGGKETTPMDERAPLVSDRSGNTFAAWKAGYPTSNELWVDGFRGGNQTTKVRLWRGTLDRIALAVEPDGKLWAVWTAGGMLHAARSRSAGAHFGAQVTVPLSGTAYQLEALARAGSATAYVNTGAAIVASPQLLPGLAVRLFTTSAKIGSKTVVTHWAQALDDGAGVGGATFTAGGKTVHADGSGKAKLAALPHRRAGTVSASGYTSAGFRVP